MAITFCEKHPGNMRIVWLDSETLVNEKVIDIPDECEYFEKKLCQLLESYKATVRT